MKSVQRSPSTSQIDADELAWRLAAQSVLAVLAPDVIEIDLHGYHPDDICGEPLSKMIQQAWEVGAKGIRFIHGHGRGRGISPSFVNTNTGYFGLRIRGELRSCEELRRWIKHTTLNCGDFGATTIKLKNNPSPSRSSIDKGVYPDSSIQYRRESSLRGR